MKTTVRREDDRVWLEGVQGWFYGEKESSVHAAQEAVMRAIGEEITYNYLVGVSGLAFRMQVSKRGLCPSSPHSFCGYQCVARSTQALARNVTILQVKPQDSGKVKEARAAVMESIDRGIPVQYGREEDGLIVGYQKRGEEWICLHPMRDGGRMTFVETNWPWGIAVFGDRKAEVPPKCQLALASLQQAVDMAKAEEAGNYFVGFKAWDEYIQRLRDLEKTGDKARNDAMLGNAWIYECLAQYRASAARYLREVMDLFDAQAAECLTRAAALYDEMSSQVLRDREHCVVTIAPYAWALKGGRVWTAEMRQEQIRRLEAALPLERAAIAEIEEALMIGKSMESAEPSAPANAAKPLR